MRKFLLNMSGFSLFGGLMFVLCTAGLSDNDLLDLKAIVISCIIATVLMVIGYIGLKVNKWEYLDD